MADNLPCRSSPTMKFARVNLRWNSRSFARLKRSFHGPVIAMIFLSFLGTVVCGSLSWRSLHAHSSFTLVKSQSEKRPLILISGFIHDVSDFIEEHPGGAHFIRSYIGKDATTGFFGGVYDHSNAAHNVCCIVAATPINDLRSVLLIAPSNETRRCFTRWTSTRSRR